MMTREEAIQHLRVDWFQARSGQICVNPDRKDPFLAAIDMAIIALALQEVNAPYEKNHPGCPICRNHEVLAWDMCNDGIVIESDGRIHMLCGGDWEALIRYCPNCGRPLSKEAEAALKKRKEEDNESDCKRSHDCPPPNDPLTLEELREMDGEPVWVVEYPDWGHWELSANAEDYVQDRREEFYGMKYDDPDGKFGLHLLGWLAYRRKPGEIVRCKEDAEPR